LESELPAPLDEGVLERIVSETRGNPLALHPGQGRADPAALVRLEAHHDVRSELSLRHCASSVGIRIGE
jgi:hypothetical protein